LFVKKSLSHCAVLEAMARCGRPDEHNSLLLRDPTVAGLEDWKNCSTPVSLDNIRWKAIGACGS